MSIVEQTVVRKALELDLSQRELAQMLGMSRTTLRKKMRRYGLLQ